MKQPLLWAVCLSASGCTYLGSAKDFDSAELRSTSGWISVENVSPLLQEDEMDCGAAALAMVMNYWGVPTTIEDVTAVHPPAPERGIGAGDLRDYARSKGLKSFLFHGKVEDLEKELSRRRPVMVGLVKRHVTAVVTHYEVVVAIHPERKTVVTLDPAHGWRQNSFEGFWGEWEPAGRVTLVFFLADQDAR